MDRVRLERLTQHGQEVPLPLTAQERIGQILEILPARALGIIAPTGGEHMEMGMILPIPPMRVEHRDVATLQCLPPDCAIEIIQALRTTAHQGAQHDRRVVVEGRAEHRRHRQDNMAIDDPLVEDLAHLADPVVDVDFGTS